jgi:hypothetical protein
MLRETVLRAFAARPGRDVALVEPAAPRDRFQAVHRFFEELHRSFARGIAARRRAPEACETGSQGPRSQPAGAAPCLGPLRVYLEGFEFSLQVGSEAYRFLNSLRGAIRVLGRRGDQENEIEVLSVESTPRGLVPIRKPAGCGRRPFFYTSVEALVTAYLVPERAGCTEC